MTEYCSHCGASMSAFWHKVTPGLVRILAKVYAGVHKSQENKVRVADLDLNNYEYSNFQKLRFHALIARYRENGQVVGGTWLITKRGAAFLRNDMAVPDRVKTFRNKVIAHGDHLVTVGDVMKSDATWQQREDFKDQLSMVIFGEPDTDIDALEVIKKTKKKKGKKYCTKCESIMGIALVILKQIDDHTVKTKQVYNCTKCGFEEDMI